MQKLKITSESFSQRQLENLDKYKLCHKALWFAVLERALLDASGNNSGVAIGALHKKKAINWCLNWAEEDVNYVGTFPWICEYLDINPVKIRKKIKQALQSGKKIANNHIRADSIHRFGFSEPEMGFIIDIEST